MEASRGSLQDSIRRAWEARATLHSEADRADPLQNSYRLFHGFHDGLRGLNIDRLGDTCLVSIKKPLTDHLPAIQEGIEACHDFERIVVRVQRPHNYNPRPLSVTALAGTLPDAPVEVRDNGLRYLMDVAAEANPGLFLDARPVRAWLLENSAGRRVLNLFAFTGSLGIAAAAGGAKSVTHVDSNPAALAVARQNHALNQLDIEDRDCLRGDLYYHLPRAAKSGRTFDGIILDPPPQRPRSKHRKPRGQDYPKLARLTTTLLAPGAWLLCFFHRYERTRHTYEEQVLSNAACELEVVWRGTSGEDFPEKDPDQKLRLTAFRRPGHE